MLQKKKTCSNCGEERYIWKTVGRDRYCISCTAILFPPKPLIKNVVKINPVSKKRKKDNEIYSRLRKDFLLRNLFCSAKLHGCTRYVDDIHHKKGRGKYFLDTTTWIGVCRSCHRWITENSRQAIELGLSDSRIKKAA